MKEIINVRERGGEYGKTLPTKNGGGPDRRQEDRNSCMEEFLESDRLRVLGEERKKGGSGTKTVSIKRGKFYGRK